MSRVLFLVVAIVLIATGCSGKSASTGANDSSSPTPTATKPASVPAGEGEDRVSVATKLYESPDGWRLSYPASWDRQEESFIQQTQSGKTISFSTAPCTKSELDAWVKSEIERKLDATEADNSLLKPLSVEEGEDILRYTYAITSKMDGAQYDLTTVIYYDGERRYEFSTQSPPVTMDEFEDILQTFEIVR